MNSKPPHPGWVLVNRDSSPYHVSGVYRWVPPGDPAIDGRREQGHEGISLATALIQDDESCNNVFSLWSYEDVRKGLINAVKNEHEDKPILPIKLTPKRVDKAWGYELWVCNNDEFCGKLLHFNKSAMFSCHSHHQKREVFEVERGLIRLMTIDQRDASQHILILKPGDVVEIPRFLPHQITALEESDVREYSTTHRDSDSYRIIAGDSQKT